MKNTFKASQYVKPTGMARTGGMMSKGSTPSVSGGMGLSAMQNILLKGPSSLPKSMTGGGGRQFLTKADDYVGRKKANIEK